MKRLALCSTAALLALAGSTRPAAAGGFMIAWSRTAPAPTAQTTEKVASGYAVTWGKGQQATERTKSGFMVAWSKSGE